MSQDSLTKLCGEEREKIPGPTWCLWISPHTTKQFSSTSWLSYNLTTTYPTTALCPTGQGSVPRGCLPLRMPAANTQCYRHFWWNSWRASRQCPSCCCCCCCCCKVTSVVSDSVQPHRRQPTRLPRPWDSPGKNTGVGCHFLLQCMKVKSASEVAQSCPTLNDSMDCSPPGSSIHGIFQARVLEWGAIAFSMPFLGSTNLLNW